MKKFLTVVAAGFAVLILSWIVLIGAVYAWGGVMTVQVQDRSEEEQQGISKVCTLKHVDLSNKDQGMNQVI